jgi:hypothetical protein
MEAEKVFICSSDGGEEDDSYDFLNGTLPKDVKNLVCADAVPGNIGEFVNLEKFSFVADLDTLGFPTQVLKVNTITHLFIRGDAIIGDDNLRLIEKMSQLKVLSIDRCSNITSLRLENLHNLRYLEIARSAIRLINLSVLAESLQHLIIRFSDIKEIPDDVYQLWRLRTLDISETCVSTVSRRISGLVNLKYFAWSHYMREVDVLKLNNYQMLPDRFYEMMDVDISSKTFEDLFKEDYGEEYCVPEQLLQDLDEECSDEEEEDEDEGEIDIDDYASDEGYESDDGSDELARVIDRPKFVENPEFYVDYLSREDKRVPNWMFLFDD